MSWQIDSLKLWRDGKSWNEITQIIQGAYFSEESFSRIRERVRGYIRGLDEYKGREKQTTHEETVVGVIGDLHAPFNHPNYLRFLIDTFKKHNVTQIVSIGDIVDNHATSRFQTETCARGAVDELEMSIKALKEYAEAFPKIKVCRGNHDTVIERQAATVNIDKRYLKSLFDVLQLPKGWELQDEYIIDNVLYKHGINCGGSDGALRTALQERMSTVIGHYHSGGGVKYSANPRDIIFGLNVGCGIDIRAYSFAYAQHAKFRPTLGCGIVYNSSSAVFVPMSQNYFRD